MLLALEIPRLLQAFNGQIVERKVSRSIGLVLVLALVLVPVLVLVLVLVPHLGTGPGLNGFFQAGSSTDR